METKQNESWLAVAGYEGAYEVSDLGRVRSLPGGHRHGKVLKLSCAGRGYLTVWLCVEGVSHRFYVHHLVAIAFIGPRPDGMYVCHGGPDFTDNRAVNLRYDTQHANMRDALVDGTHRSVTRTHCIHGHEMTEENTYYERRMSADGNGVKTRRRCRQCNRKTARSERRNRQHGPRTVEVDQFLARSSTQQT